MSLASVVAGLATFGAYALVLAALKFASAASVAAVRATSVIIANSGAASFAGFQAFAPGSRRPSQFQQNATQRALGKIVGC